MGGWLNVKLHACCRFCLFGPAHLKSGGFLKRICLIDFVGGEEERLQGCYGHVPDQSYNAMCFNFPTRHCMIVRDATVDPGDVGNRKSLLGVM